MIKSKAVGFGLEGEDTMFDNTNEITKLLTSSHWPFEYYVCIDDSSYTMKAFQLTFADMDGNDLVMLPMIGQKE